MAMREPLRQMTLGDEAKLPFPTQTFGHSGFFKLFASWPTRALPGDRVIW
jgi:hypothetical protein